MMRKLWPLAIVLTGLGAGLSCAAVAAIPQTSPGAEHRALSPSAPVQLTYALPAQLPVAARVDIPVDISAQLPSGRVHFEVVNSAGVVVVDGAIRDFWLQNAEQPFRHVLSVVLGNESNRFIVLQVTVDSPMGQVSRSFRIDFPSTQSEIKSQRDDAEPLKLLPATRPH